MVGDSKNKSSGLSRFLAPIRNIRSRSREPPRLVDTATDVDLQPQPVPQPAPLGQQTRVAESQPDSPSVDLWTRAEQNLKERKPHVHDALQRLKDASRGRSLSGKDFNEILGTRRNDANRKYDSQKSGVQRYLINAGYILSALRGTLNAPTRSDPAAATSVIVPAMISLLDVALAKTGLDQAIYRDIEDIFNKIEPCHYKEIHVLGARNGRVEVLYNKAEIALVAFYGAVLEYLVCAAHCLDDTYFGGMLKTPIKSKDILELKREVDWRYRTSEIKFDSLKWDKEFMKSQGEILKWITDQDMLEVHRGLMRAAKIDDMHETAGNWLPASDEYQQWDHGTGLKVFWLCGTAGTGKTTLCSKIIARLDEPARMDGNGLAYVYCSETGTSVKGAATWRAVINSVIRQLCEVKGQSKLVEPVARFHAEHQEKRRDGASLDVKEQRELLEDISRLGHPIYIIIDALDECDEPLKVLKMLKKASEVHGGKLRILVSSRHGVKVEHKDSFRGVTKQILVKDLTKNDMHNYIYKEIFEREERILDGRDPEREEKLCQALLEQANGMFKWAQLRLHLIFKGKTGKSISYADARDVDELIEKIKLRSISEDEQLNDIWSQMLEHNTEGRSHARQNALRAFKLVLGAFYSLSFNQIREALQIIKPEAGDYTQPYYDDLSTDYVSSITQNFLIETEGVATFAHMSAVDFLRGSHKQSDLSNLAPLDCHTELMYTCLHFLRSLPGCSGRKAEDVVAHITATRVQGRPSDRVDYMFDSFLDYALWNWPVHCATTLILSEMENRKRLILHISRDILNHGDWQQSLRIWYHVHGVRYDDGPFRYYGYPGNGRVRDLVHYCIARSPGVFIASSFHLPDLVEQLARLPLWQKDALNSFNFSGDCPVMVALHSPPGFESDLIGDIWQPQQTPDNGVFTCLPPVIETLLRLGADPNLKIGPSYTVALGICECWNSSSRSNFRTDFAELLGILFAHGMNLHACDSSTRTILHHAVRWNDAAVIDWLLSKGIGIDTYNKDNGSKLTPLKKAVIDNERAAFVALIERGAKVEIPFPGETPLHLATRMEYTPSFARWTYLRCDKLNHLTHAGRTPLMEAVHQANPAWTEHLLDLLAEQNPTQMNENAIAFGASTRRRNVHFTEHMSVLCHLYLRGVLFDVQDDYGVTPLMIAVSRLDLTGMRCLLQFGCDVNATDNSGRTALHYCATTAPGSGRRSSTSYERAGYRFVARRILISAGAALDRQDHYGNTYETLLSITNRESKRTRDQDLTRTARVEIDSEKRCNVQFQEDLRQRYTPRTEPDYKWVMASDLRLSDEVWKELFAKIMQSVDKDGSLRVKLKSKRVPETTQADGGVSKDEEESEMAGEI